MVFITIEQRLNLQDKNDWTLDNAAQIADYFGYENDDNFRQALLDYREEFVERASVTGYLAIIAARFFGNYEPPLKRLPTKTKTLFNG